MSQLRPEDAQRVQALQQAIGYTFAQPQLALTALTHPSWRGEHPGCTDNQRLEYLGDAVLQLAAASFLYGYCPQQDEGLLTRLRAVLVCQQALSGYARQYGLEPLMRCGRAQQPPHSDGLLSDAYEAVLAAVYLDGGYAPAAAMAEKCLAAYAPQAMNQLVDEKSALQEWLAGQNLPAPVYDTAYHSGPSHNPVYQTTVYVEGRAVGVGRGGSKKAAEKQAAGQALAALRQQN